MMYSIGQHKNTESWSDHRYSFSLSNEKGRHFLIKNKLDTIPDYTPTRWTKFMNSRRDVYTFILTVE